MTPLAGPLATGLWHDIQCRVGIELPIKLSLTGCDREAHSCCELNGYELCVSLH